MKELISQIQKRTEMQIALDDLVHDTKSQEASEINNGGPESQVQYLLESGFSLEDIITEINTERRIRR